MNAARGKRIRAVAQPIGSGVAVVGRSNNSRWGLLPQHLGDVFEI